ncbi:FadR family transcriptional regulator [Peribacillus cavernae]|uniref:FadR family transcriptional regulator n=1 Tax=Peribacillus cavernae TaxID=1674310 RepID=A0A3S0TWY6_9BACI|nr:FadR/GntR family transcriptional regulator [Peribacillus cavernae]MDQ0221267.1 DNA-binding FadR family transcriptional regulator [Peribacillus cavernae]RUQ25107.1 FadR family transcriptional regulator [Peribacillus cavernae]
MSVNKRKAFSEIIEEIKKNIMNGNYPVGSRLPAERVLAEEYKASRGTVREALRALESIDVIESKVGQGTFVKTTNFAESDIFTEIANQTSPSEVFAARFAIEPYLAELAAHNASQEDILFMETCLKRMEAEIGNIEEFEKQNTDFHYRIALAAKNSLLQNFIDIIEKIHTEKLWGTLRARSFRDGKMKIYHQQHAAIYEAIKDRDKNKARECTILHLKTVKTNMLGE